MPAGVHAVFDDGPLFLNGGVVVVPADVEVLSQDVEHAFFQLVDPVINLREIHVQVRKPELVGEIVRAVTAVCDVPVTVKIREGWDDGSVNAVEIAQICERAGAVAITVHGRTRMQYYKPPVDYEIIRQVRQSVGIPVIANGDIDSAQKAKEVMERTGCDLVMVGRASLGNPWLFGQINAYLSGGKLFFPTLEEKLDTMVGQVEKMVEYKGEYIAMRQARKLVIGYFKGMKGAAALRNEAGKLSALEDIYKLRNRILNT